MPLESPKPSGSPQSCFCQLTRCPLFLAHLLPDEPDTKVVINILVCPCQPVSTPSSSSGTMGALEGPWVQVPTPLLTGWVTLSETVE